MNQQFRKKPVVIEAIQWTGENLLEIIKHTGQHASAAHFKWEVYEDLVRRERLKIFTLEGSHMATVGDWIIKGVKGECYPCKPDIFAATYEPAEASPASVPEGYAIVPVEPTMEMCEAGWNEYDLQDHFSVRFMYERMIAADPTSPVSEDRKDAQIERLEHLTTAIDDRCGKTIEKQSAALKLAREALFDMQDSYAAVHGWKDSFVIAATTAIAAIDEVLGE